MNQLTGKLEAELLHDAVEQLVQQAAASNRLTALRQARGMWQHRTVLSNFDQVRSAGWETTLAANE